MIKERLAKKGSKNRLFKNPSILFRSGFILFRLGFGFLCYQKTGTKNRKKEKHFFPKICSFFLQWSISPAVLSSFSCHFQFSKKINIDRKLREILHKKAVCKMLSL